MGIITAVPASATRRVVHAGIVLRCHRNEYFLPQKSLTRLRAASSTNYRSVLLYDACNASVFSSHPPLSSVTIVSVSADSVIDSTGTRRQQRAV